MKIKDKKSKIILAVVVITIILFLLLINRTRIMKNNIVAKSEYEVELNGISISLDNIISKTPNVPVVGAGMIPIKWNDTVKMWEITTSTDIEWYDYSTGKWANIMLSDGYYKSELQVGIDAKLQLMENNIGTQIADTSKLGTIYTWVPKLMYNETDVQYLKDTSIVEYNWTTPTCFTYAKSGANSINLEVTGMWVGKETNTDVAVIESKNNSMNSEDNTYGLIKNEIVSTITNEEKIVIEKLNEKNGNISNETTLSNILPTEYKQVIKIIKTDERELITPKYIPDSNLIILKTRYSKNGIRLIADKDGNKISDNENATYEPTEEEQYVFYYVDNIGNIKKYQVNYLRPNIKYFNKNTTFYVTYDEKGNEISEVPIGEKAPKGWYDYETQKWANIVCRDNGDELYYVWIPRYMYILNDNETVDAKLVDLENCYTDSDGNRINLEEEEYQLPEAFTWNGEQISGYWMSKYKLRDDSTTRLTATVAGGFDTIRVSNIINNTGESVTYEVSLIKDGIRQGNAITLSDTEEYTFTGLEYGDYSIHVVAVSGENQIAGYVSQVKLHKLEEPSLIGFMVDCTYIVTYDDAGNANETQTLRSVLKEDAVIENGALVSGEVDRSKINGVWYNYAEQKWANIVTKANNQTLYYVWIPRYEYLLDNVRQNARVILIPKDKTTPDNGYQIPEAFTWNGTPVSGYWMSKYKLRS